MEDSTQALVTPHPLIGRQHIQRRFHLQRENLGESPLAARRADGEGVGACRCWRAAQKSRGRVQGQSGHRARGDPAPVAGAQGAHLVGAHACAALGSDRCPHIGGRQPAGDAGRLVRGLRRKAVGDRQARARRGAATAAAGCAPDADTAIGLLRRESLCCGKNLREAGARGGLVGTAIVGVAPRLQRPVRLHGHKSQSVGINFGEASAYRRSSAAAGVLPPGDDRPVRLQRCKCVLGGINGRITGAGRRAAAAPEGVTPSHDLAAGIERCIGTAVARNIDKIVAAGEQHIPRNGVAPGAEGAIAIQRHKSNRSGIDSDVAVIGGRVIAATIAGVAPDRDRAIALQGCEGGAVGGDCGVAGGRRCAGATCCGVAPGGDAAIRLHGRHGVAAGEDLGEPSARGRAGAAACGRAPSGDAAIGLHGGEGGSARIHPGVAQVYGRARAAIGAITPGADRTVLIQRSEGAGRLGDLYIAVVRRHAERPGPAGAAITPGDDRAIRLQRGESIGVEPLPAGAIRRQSRTLANPLVGQGAVVDINGEQLRRAPRCVGHRQRELVNARHRGCAAQNTSTGSQCHAGGERTDDVLVLICEGSGIGHGQVVADRLADAEIGITPAFGLPVGSRNSTNSLIYNKTIIFTRLPAFVVAGHREGVETIDSWNR